MGAGSKRFITCSRKQTFPTYEIAEKVRKKLKYKKRVQTYYCHVCGKYHLGKPK